MPKSSMVRIKIATAMMPVREMKMCNKLKFNYFNWGLLFSWIPKSWK